MLQKLFNLIPEFSWKSEQPGIKYCLNINLNGICFIKEYWINGQVHFANILFQWPRKNI